MVKDNRIQTYRFPLSDLVATADGIIDAYTSFPLNGKINAIQNVAGNFAATGSLFLTESGTGEVIFTLTSGTNNAAQTFTSYPRINAVNNINISIGSNVGNWYTEMSTDSVLHLIGSGLGNGTSGVGINIRYK